VSLNSVAAAILLGLKCCLLAFSGGAAAPPPSGGANTANFARKQSCSRSLQFECPTSLCAATESGKPSVDCTCNPARSDCCYYLLLLLLLLLLQVVPA
jgi:hypothetical protein